LFEGRAEKFTEFDQVRTSFLELNKLKINN